MASVADVLRVASSQVGYVEGGGSDGHSGNITKYGSEFGLNGEPWCAMFVWWVYKQVGIDLRKTVTSYYASTVYDVNSYRSKGWWHSGVSGMKPSDIVFFDFPGGDWVDHTGICEYVDAHGIHTIEGNTSSGNVGSQANGGGCYRRLRDASTIIGYARVPLLKQSVIHRATQKAKQIRHAVVGPKNYPTFKDGSRGAGVERLQKLLVRAGISVGAEGADGNFGTSTQRAVMAYQARKGLWRDGVAGPKTLSTIGW